MKNSRWLWPSCTLAGGRSAHIMLAPWLPTKSFKCALAAYVRRRPRGGAPCRTAPPPRSRARTAWPWRRCTPLAARWRVRTCVHGLSCPVLASLLNAMAMPCHAMACHASTRPIHGPPCHAMPCHAYVLACCTTQTPAMSLLAMPHEFRLSHAVLYACWPCRATPSPGRAMARASIVGVPCHHAAHICSCPPPAETVVASYGGALVCWSVGNASKPGKDGTTNCLQHACLFEC